MTGRVAALAVATLGSLVALADQVPPFRDVVVIGGQRYVRTERTLHTETAYQCTELAVAARDGLCAAVYRKNHYPDYMGYLRHFGPWNTPWHDPVMLDPDEALHAEQCAVAVYGDRTWVAWYYPLYDYTTWARIFDHAGQPLSESFAVCNLLRLLDPGRDLRIAMTDSRVALVICPFPDGKGGTQKDLYFRIYDPDGQPLSELLPLATDDYYTEELPSIALLSDGSFVVEYAFGRRTYNPIYVQLVRINPDLSIEPPVRLDERTARTGFIRALADDSLLVAYHLADESVGFLRRYDSHCQPLGEPVSVDPQFWYAAATSDGRLVLAGASYPEVWIRLYDAQGQALSERLDFTSGLHPDGTFYGANVPLAYDDNGTIWIAWNWAHGYTSLLTSLTPFEPGDMNYDRRVDNFDITPFVMALADPAEYQAHYPGLPYEFLGDVNEDGRFDNFDITPFVQLLTR